MIPCLQVLRKFNSFIRLSKKKHCILVACHARNNVDVVVRKHQIYGVVSAVWRASNCGERHCRALACHEAMALGCGRADPYNFWALGRHDTKDPRSLGKGGPYPKNYLKISTIILLISDTHVVDHLQGIRHYLNTFQGFVISNMSVTNLGRFSTILQDIQASSSDF
jgi:hypothetical protein